MRTKTIGYGLLILALSLLSACIIGITIGGNVTGLTGTGLVLQNNGGDDLPINADGPFTFKTPLPTSGGPYAVTVKTQPSGQVCTVSDGVGTATAHVTNVSVQCVANWVTVGGNVTGLTGTGLVLQNSGGDDLVINATGNFTFGAQVVIGGTYAVTVKTQPSGQVCTVSDGAGSATSNVSNVSVQCVANAPAALQLLAGSLGGRGNIDGTGLNARFNNPMGIAVDSAGTVYVADSYNHTIRKVNPAGGVTTLAGTAGSSGSTDGAGAAARFASPSAIAVDGVGTIYVSSNHTIRRITPAGVVTTLAGLAGSSSSADGVGAAARFDDPLGIAVDSAGTIYVADTVNHTIRKISPAGVVTTLAGSAGNQGSADGTGSSARFYFPRGIVVDGGGNAYVVDGGNNTIRKISPAGVVTTLAGTAGRAGSVDGAGVNAKFNIPFGITLDSAGNTYVTERKNHTIRKISSTGVVTTVAGSAGSAGSVDGTGAVATFNYPTGITLDSAGNIYVADSLNHTIRKISPAGIVTTLAGAASSTGSADGTGAVATFNYPTGITLDSMSNAYVVDSNNRTIRRISLVGEVTTLAKTPEYVGKWTPPRGPNGIAIDNAGIAYVADTGNSTILKISPAGVVTTLAGMAGVSGSVDGTGVAARFDSPHGIAVDDAGNVYVTDGSVIRKISPVGMVTTLAGTAGNYGSANGTGVAAQFFSPEGIAVDSAGTVYVADTGNHTIRKISPAGVVTTLAGFANYYGSADGTGAAAMFYYPVGLALDSSGNLYVADHGSATIRKVSPAGVVSTVLGSAGKMGVQLGALPSTLAYPYGVAVSGDKLFVISENMVLWAPKP